jgi:hypothetical protein
MGPGNLVAIHGVVGMSPVVRARTVPNRRSSDAVHRARTPSVARRVRGAPSSEQAHDRAGISIGHLQRSPVSDADAGAPAPRKPRLSVIVLLQ